MGVLVGRAEERERIGVLLEQARSGHSAVLALAGEPGIGKTVLLDLAVRSATGFQLLQVRAVESEAHIPFSSLLELLRPALGSLERIPRPQAEALESALALRPGRPAERFAVGAATLSVLAAWAERAPVLMIVDDAQWVDPSSAEALRFATRRLVADPIAVLIAVRDGAPSFVDGSGFPFVHVDGLGRDEARALLAGVISTPDLADRAHRATGGNPLALLELSKDTDILAFASGGGEFPVPDAISKEFLRRAHNLDDQASRVLALAATNDDGDALTVERAAEALGLDFTALGRSEEVGLLRLKGGRVEFRHPLARSAIYSATPPEARRAAHRALASVLSDRDIDRRAWHLAAATVGTDASASEAMKQAGQRASARSGYAVAAAAFERAAWLAVDDTERGSLFLDAARAAWLAGLTGLSKELLARARPLEGEFEGVPGLAHLEGEIALHVGPVMDGYDVLLTAAGRAEGDLAVEFLAEACIACLYAGRPTQMLVTADRACSLLSPTSSVRARFLASMSRGMALVLGGDAQEGAGEIRAAASLTVAGAFPEDQRLTTWLVMGPVWLREGLARRAVVDRALETARSRSAVGSLPFLLNHLARDQAGGQEWAAAGACYEESVSLCRETGQRTELAVALAGLAWLEARLGRAEACRAHAAEGAELCRDLGMGLIEVWAVAALGELELGLGHAAEAASYLETQGKVLDDRGITDPDVSPVPELVDAYLRLGRRADAELVAQGFRRRAANKGQAWSLARAQRCEGMVCGDDGFDEPFTKALALHDETPDAFERARTSLAYGARLRRARQRVKARTCLREALETFEKLGASPWYEQARAELAATGETVPSQGAGLVRQLTPQELQVALLLARGSSTREAAASLFLSPKTVEYHLRHVYQKLNVRSREELLTVLGDRR